MQTTARAHGAQRFLFPPWYLSVGVPRTCLGQLEHRSSCNSLVSLNLDAFAYFLLLCHCVEQALNTGTVEADKTRYQSHFFSEIGAFVLWRAWPCVYSVMTVVYRCAHNPHSVVQMSKFICSICVLNLVPMVETLTVTVSLLTGWFI